MIDAALLRIACPENSAQSTGWSWYDNDLDAKAATTGIEDDREAINGGQTGVNEVRRRFDNRIAEMLRRERAAA
jgi:predicted chitinase